MSGTKAKRQKRLNTPTGEKPKAPAVEAEAFADLSPEQLAAVVRRCERLIEDRIAAKIESGEAVLITAVQLDGEDVEDAKAHALARHGPLDGKQPIYDILRIVTGITPREKVCSGRIESGRLPPAQRDDPASGPCRSPSAAPSTSVPSVPRARPGKPEKPSLGDEIAGGWFDVGEGRRDDGFDRTLRFPRSWAPP